MKKKRKFVSQHKLKKAKANPRNTEPGKEKRKLTALIPTAIQMLVVLEAERPAISTIVAEQYITKYMNSCSTDSLATGIAVLMPAACCSSLPVLMPAACCSSLPVLMPVACQSSLPVLMPAACWNSLPVLMPAACWNSCIRHPTKSAFLMQLLFIIRTSRNPLKSVLSYMLTNCYTLDFVLSNLKLPILCFQKIVLLAYLHNVLQLLQSCHTIYSISQCHSVPRPIDDLQQQKTYSPRFCRSI